MVKVQTPFSLRVRDPEGVISFTRENIIAYAGLDQLIASAVVMRLLSSAFSALTEDGTPWRHQLRILTAFGGRGVHDALELVTRAVTRNRFIYDPTVGSGPATPEGGKMYFEVCYGTRALGFRFSERLFDETWRARVISEQAGCPSASEHAAYMAYKYGIVGELLSAPDAIECLGEVDCARLLTLKPSD